MLVYRINSNNKLINWIYKKKTVSNLLKSKSKLIREEIAKKVLENIKLNNSFHMMSKSGSKGDTFTKNQFGHLK